MRINLIDIGGRMVRRFIPFPGPVEDDTVRCICCGQIDEDGFHDYEVCCGIASGTVKVEDNDPDDK